MPHEQTFSPAGRSRAIPAWLVPLLSLPIRRIWDDPARIVLPLVEPGQRILELGPGSGFFTLPMAWKLGHGGRLHAIELQERVRQRLSRKLQGRGLGGIVEVRACECENLLAEDLEGRIDLAVAIHVLHETPDPRGAIAQLGATLRPGGTLLIREPAGHCPEELWRAELGWALAAGLLPIDPPSGVDGGVRYALFRR